MFYEVLKTRGRQCTRGGRSPRAGPSADPAGDLLEALLVQQLQDLGPAHRETLRTRSPPSSLQPTRAGRPRVAYPTIKLHLFHIFAL